MKTLRAAMSMLLLAGLCLVAKDCPAWDVPDVPGGGLRLYVEKTTYRVGEPVRFMLFKHVGVDDMPANLEGSYYVIERREGNRGVEFYTSKREPFGTSLGLEKELIWKWNQKDNERTHTAEPGKWRLRFYAPKGNIGSKPLEAYFTIQ
jgi:hypothetical protein